MTIRLEELRTVGTVEAAIDHRLGIAHMGCEAYRHGDTAVVWGIAVGSWRRGSCSCCTLA